MPSLLKPSSRRTCSVTISKLFFTAVPIPPTNWRLCVCVCVCVCVCCVVLCCVVLCCVVSVIVKRPVLPPCAVDGHYRNPLSSPSSS